MGSRKRTRVGAVRRRSPGSERSAGPAGECRPAAPRRPAGRRRRRRPRWTKAYTDRPRRREAERPGTVEPGRADPSRARSGGERRGPRRPARKPEHRRRVVYHCLEPLPSPGAHAHQPERDGPPDEEGVGGGLGVGVPAAQEFEQAKVPAECEAGPGPGEDGCVRGAEGRRHDQQADELGPRSAKGRAHQVRRHDLRARHAGEAEPLQVGPVYQQVEPGDQAEAPEQPPRHVAGEVTHLGGEVGRLVPPAVREEHKDHGHAEAPAPAN